MNSLGIKLTHEQTSHVLTFEYDTPHHFAEHLDLKLRDGYSIEDVFLIEKRGGLSVTYRKVTTTPDVLATKKKR